MLSTITKLRRRRRRAPAAAWERTPQEDAALERAVGFTAQLLSAVFSTAAFYLELQPDGRSLHVVESRRAQEILEANMSFEQVAELAVALDELDAAIELRPALELLRVLRLNLQLALSESADARAAAMPAIEMSRCAYPLQAAWRPLLM